MAVVIARWRLMVLALGVVGCAAHAGQAGIRQDRPASLADQQQAVVERDRQARLHDGTGEAFGAGTAAPAGCTNTEGFSKNSFGAVRTQCK